MVDARLGHGDGHSLRKARFIPGEHGGENIRRVPGKQRADFLPHGPAQTNRPPAGACPAAVAGLYRSPAVGQQKHAPGGKGGHVVLPDAGGAFQIHIRGDGLSGLQAQKLLPAVVHQPPRQALRLYGGLGAVGIVRQGHDQTPLCLRQGLHGPLDLAEVQPVIAKGQGQAHSRQQHPLAPLPG